MFWLLFYFNKSRSRGTYWESMFRNVCWSITLLRAGVPSIGKIPTYKQRRYCRVPFFTHVWPEMDDTLWAH